MHILYIVSYPKPYAGLYIRAGCIDNNWTIRRPSIWHLWIYRTLSYIPYKRHTDSLVLIRLVSHASSCNRAEEIVYAFLDSGELEMKKIAIRTVCVQVKYLHFANWILPFRFARSLEEYSPLQESSMVVWRRRSVWPKSLSWASNSRRHTLPNGTAGLQRRGFAKRSEQRQRDLKVM